MSIERVGSLLAGRYENSVQVTQGRKDAGPPPQHVVISIEPTAKPEWQLWRIHMDVDPAVAQTAGSESSLDAVWAMNLVRQSKDQSLSLIPFTLKTSVGIGAVQAATFDASQWLTLEGCMLRGDFGKARILVHQAVDEMCAAEAMGLGGKRAFLPISIDGDGERLQVQLIFFGEPWMVDAHRMQDAARTTAAVERSSLVGQ